MKAAGGTGRLAREFAELSFFHLEELFTDIDPTHPVAAPPALPLFTGVRKRVLTPRVRLRLGTAAGARLDAEALSTLLYYGYGFSRVDVGPKVEWPLHRFVPSARCLFPVELFVCALPGGDWPPGVFHYDPLHHRLEELRGGDFRSVLEAVLGVSLEGCAAVALLAPLLWKNAFKYQNFAYRLAGQETGMVVGNLQLVAAALGLSAQLRLRFLDAPLRRLVGVDGEGESVFAALLLGGESAAPSARRASAEELLAEISPLDAFRAGRAEVDARRCARMLELDGASVMETWEAVEPVDALARRCEGGCLAPTRTEPVPDLAGALHARNSGDLLFAPLAVPLAASDFWGSLKDALAPLPGELDPAAGTACLNVYIAVNHVRGVEAGLYRLCPGCGGLRQLAAGDHSERAQALYRQPWVNCMSAAFVCYIGADVEAAIASFGDRGYRMVTIAAGVVAQRICVKAAGHGISVRTSDAYGVAECRAMLELPPGHIPLFQLVAGRDRPGAGAGERFRLQLRF